MEKRINGFLRSLERYTKTDMVYLARGSFWLSVGQAVAVLSAFVLSIALAHFLTKETFGNYKFILSLAGIIGGLSLSGLATALTQAVARGKEGTIYLAVKTQLHWGNVVALAGLGTALYYYLNNNILLAVALVIVALALPVTNSTGLYGAYINGKKDFRRGTLYWIIGQLINTTVVITLAFFTHNVLALVAGYFISNLLTSIYFYRRTLALYKPTHESADAEMIRYGNHLSVMGFIGIIANQLDKILVFHYAGAAPLAIYAFANALPEQARGFLKNIFGVGTPKFALLDRLALRKSITDKMLRLTALTAVGVVLYYFLAPFIYQVFFPQYIDSIFYSQLYMIGIIFFPGISLFALYFQLMKETKVLYILTIVGNAVTIIFSLLLIPRYGILGAVIENTLSWFTMLLINFFYFARDTASRDRGKEGSAEEHQQVVG